MTKIFTKGNNAFYDDYVYHPTEIKSILSGIKKATKKDIIAVFQPHRYSRLRLKNDFSKCFKNASKVLILPLFCWRKKRQVL